MAVKIQHLRSSTASKRPTSTALLDGELSINTNVGTPGVFFEDANGGIVKVGPAEVGSSAPNATPASGGSSGNTTGEFWFDTANAGGNGQAALKIFSGSNFVNIGKVTIGNTNIEVGASATTSITGLSSLSSTDINVSTSLDLENQADLRFYEATANGSNYVGFQAPATIAADVLWTLPGSDGTANQVLTTNGAGVLSWTEARTNDISQGDSSVTVTDTGSNGNIAFNTDNANRWNINSSGHLVPGTDSAYNIGASGNEVSNIFVDTLTSQVSAVFNGDVDLGNATSDSITFTGRVDSDLLPITTNAHKLGQAGLVWSEVHGTTLYGTVNEVTVVKSITGDSGTATPTAQSFKISGGTGLTATASGTTVTVDLDNTAVTPASYGGADTVSTFTVDAQGRLTAAAGVTISILHTQVSDFDSGVQTNRLDQMAAPTSSVSLNSQKITNLATPTADTDAANKGYVDSVAQGIDVKASCRLATTAALPSVTYANGTAGVGATLTADANGSLSVDGSAVVNGDRILVKNQASQLQNGIYVVTDAGSAGAPFVLTRATDMDIASEFASAFTFVESGTANADNGYVCTSDNPITVGTTAITFDQFSGAGQITAGNGLSKTGNTLDVNVDNVTLDIVSDNLQIKSTYAGQSSITTLGTVTTGTWNANIIGLSYGGTGVNNTNVSRYYAFMGPNNAAGNASFREILTSDIAPISGGSFDAGVF